MGGGVQSFRLTQKMTGRFPLNTRLIAVAAVLMVFAFQAAPAAGADVQGVHGLAMHGAPKYAADFTHLDYVNPDAPKGGALRLAAIGTFDNLNPYIIKGTPAAGAGMVFDTLLASTDDEPFSEYGLLAQSIDMAEDRSWVAFDLRPQARWHDGAPVTADDVVFSFQTLLAKGHPFYRAYYANVKEAVAQGPSRVKFVFDAADNRELPLIIGQMPVLQKKSWEGKNFDETTLTPLEGSGPYRVETVDPGRRIVYRRVADWWGRDLPINRGRYNYDTISYDYYRDEQVALQAFFAGEYDFRQENIAKAWATAYDAPPVKDGRIVKAEQDNDLPTGMQAFAFNTRRAIFADARVRQALGHAFDFEWSNKQFAFGSYVRTQSFFSNSDLASSGLPSGRELEILEGFRGKIPDEVFTTPYATPKTDGSGNLRANLKTGMDLLKGAGYAPGKGGAMEKDGKPLTFEILLNSPTFERWVAPFVQNLRKMGITATIRIVDTAQYQNRMDAFDFDMTIETFGQSLSPGNEQRDFWSSAKAEVKGSRNVIGVRDPIIDTLVDMIIAAPDRDELVARTRALDRVLLWGHYVIPQWHIGYFRLAYWDKFGRPAKNAPYGLGVVDTWWIDGQKAAKIPAVDKNNTGKK